MEDVSAIDALNEAFVHEHSVMAAAQRGGAEVSDVKARLANLEVQNFSITDMLQKNASILGRRTQQVEKTYLNGVEESKDNQLRRPNH